MNVAGRTVRLAWAVGLTGLGAVMAGCGSVTPPAAAPAPVQPPTTQASRPSTTSQAADGDVFVTDGGRFSVGTTSRRPQQFKITAQSDYALMSHITWDTWGGPTATGHGTYATGLGSQASDSSSTYPNATITLSQIRPDSHHIPEYTHVHITAPGMDSPEDDPANNAVSGS